MSSYHDAVSLLQSVDCSFLEIVELEAKLKGRELNKLVEVFNTDVVGDHPVLLRLVRKVLQLAITVSATLGAVTVTGNHRKARMRWLCQVCLNCDF